MKKFNLNLAAILFSVMLFAGAISQTGQLYAQESGYVSIQSAQSFDNTVKEVRELVAQNGMMVLSELNQGKILSMTGLSIKAVSLFVGNPQVGNKLFSADRGVGIAVPVRLNIYENTDGKTYVNYVKVANQLSPFGNAKIAMIAKKLDEKMAMLTGMLAKKN